MVKSRKRVCGGWSWGHCHSHPSWMPTTRFSAEGARTEISAASSPRPPARGTFRLRFPEMLSAGPTPAHAPGICSRRALACPQSTYIKSQSPGSGPTASDRRTQTTSASWNLCGSGSKASAPSLRPSAAAIGSGGAHSRPGNLEGDWAASLSHQLGGEPGEESTGTLEGWGL